jgi:hypothetical protein
MYAYVVVVEWAHTRPPTTANTVSSRVDVCARDDNEAQLLAAQMVACREECVMPTRTTIMELEL